MSKNSPGGTDLIEFIRARGPHCLIIARHGETDWNVLGRLQGQHDTSLNDRGRSQSSAAGRLLHRVPIDQVHSSTLGRARETAQSIVEGNHGQPTVVYADLLKETALGILEGEMKSHQSTAVLRQHYRDFSDDEINYRIPDGETLRDVFTRVERFFANASQLLQGDGVNLIVGHRNVNKMILKFLLGLTFEQGFQAEHLHQCIYFYFGESKELWSCDTGSETPRLTKGYATNTDGTYA